MENSNAQPLISIVLPVYNGERFLRQSIESCQNQTFTDWELLIIDDGSKDASPKIAKAYADQDSRIHYYKNETNLKLPKTLNKGFALAKGTYLTWTSDDNYYHPTALEKMLSVLYSTNSEFVFAKCSIINEKEEKISEIEAPKDYKFAIWDHNFVGACFMYSRRAYETVGEYDVNLFLGEDYDYWLRMFNHFQVKYIDEELYVYRRHEKALSSTHKNGQYAAVEKVLWKNFKEHKNSTMLDKFYLYRGLHYSRSLREKWMERNKYVIPFLCYKVWHKFFFRAGKKAE